MTLWVLVLVYLFVGCVRTAIMLADSAVEDEPKEVKVSAQEIGFNVIFWGNKRINCIPWKSYYYYI